ncbi:MAG TPA: hypothetical protein VL988_04080 [Solirubrobacteraceae bacterium]|nr:hypothetical protein [Solirubrobacteraceae bacterium]
MDIDAIRREVEECERELASATPETNLRSAALLREVMPKLTSVRQRELAEEIAKEFEQRAHAQSLSE